MTPYSTEVAIDGDEIVVKVMLSMDAGPMREFRPFLDVPLDEAHAVELMGKLGFAVREQRLARERREQDAALENVLAFPGGPLIIAAPEDRS